MIKICSAKGCNKTSRKNGFCLHHDYMNKTYGDPNHIVVRPPLKTKEEHRETARKAERKYTKSKKGMKTKQEYNASPSGKASQNKYGKTSKGKEINKRKDKKYYSSSKGRENQKRKRDKPKFKEKVHNERISLRTEVFSHYSKLHSDNNIPCCRCCGEDFDLEFLSLDHIAGKKQMDFEPELLKIDYSSKKEGVTLLKWIIKNKFPKGFQTLCHNCNQSKGHSKDNTCAHKRNQK